MLCLWATATTANAVTLRERPLTNPREKMLIAGLSASWCQLFMHVLEDPGVAQSSCGWVISRGVVMRNEAINHVLAPELERLVGGDGRLQRTTAVIAQTKQHDQVNTFTRSSQFLRGWNHLAIEVIGVRRVEAGFVG